MLALPLVGFLDAGDEWMWATIEVIERELGDTDQVRRWAGDRHGRTLPAGCGPVAPQGWW